MGCVLGGLSPPHATGGWVSERCPSAELFLNLQIKHVRFYAFLLRKTILVAKKRDWGSLIAEYVKNMGLKM